LSRLLAIQQPGNTHGIYRTMFPFLRNWISAAEVDAHAQRRDRFVAAALWKNAFLVLGRAVA